MKQGTLLLASVALVLGACSGGGGSQKQASPTGGSGSGSMSGGTGGDETGGSSASGGTTGGSSGGDMPGGASNASGSGGSSGSSAGAGKGGSAGRPTGKPSGTPPKLEAGVWQNITPDGVNLTDGCCTKFPNEGLDGNTFGVTWIEIDPSNPFTLYACVDVEGVWKSTDAGTSWVRLGTPPAEKMYGPTVPYLDNPVRLRVDPDDPTHLYATQGVRGASLGFWVSHDSGDTWTQPPGFIEAQKTSTNDVTTMVVDPSDFKHVLLGSHSPWQGKPAGLMETTDGGDTFVLHQPSPNWTAAGSLGVNFYFSPELKIGDSKTWLVSLDGGGLWRTTDSGGNWTKLTDLGAVHGGNNELYFTKDGTVYAGANNHILRGTDNGNTWTPVGPQSPDGYYQIIGDGNVLYALASNTGSATGAPGPYYTSPEDDGVNWAPYQDGAQTFTDGPFSMKFDSVNGILYSANWNAGVWALKVLPKAK